MEDALKPCPFCGNATAPKIMAFEGEPSIPGFVVRCDASGWDGMPGQGCGSESGWGEDREEAAAAWNRRAPTAKGEDDGTAC